MTGSAGAMCSPPVSRQAPFSSLCHRMVSNAEAILKPGCGMGRSLLSRGAASPERGPLRDGIRPKRVSSSLRYPRLRRLRVRAVAGLQFAAFWTSARRPYNARRKYVFDSLHFGFVHYRLLRACGECPAAGEVRYLCVRESNQALRVPFSRI